MSALREEKDAQAMRLYERGMARGELPADVEPRFLHGVLFGALVDLLLAGVRRPARVRAPSP